MDRSIMLAFYFGAALVTPCIHGYLGDDGPPSAWSEYVPVEDPEYYWDLPAKVRWVADHRNESRAIGRRAKDRFRAHATPAAYWRRLRARLAAAQ